MSVHAQNVKELKYTQYWLRKRHFLLTVNLSFVSNTILNVCVVVKESSRVAILKVVEAKKLLTEPRQYAKEAIHTDP